MRLCNQAAHLQKLHLLASARLSLIIWNDWASSASGSSLEAPDISSPRLLDPQQNYSLDNLCTSGRISSARPYTAWQRQRLPNVADKITALVRVRDSCCRCRCCGESVQHKSPLKQARQCHHLVTDGSDTALPKLQLWSHRRGYI